MNIVSSVVCAQPLSAFPQLARLNREQLTLARGLDAEYFGKEILGSVQGVVQMVTNGGAALGPLCLVTLMRITGLHITRIFQCYAMLSGAGFVFAALCGGRPTPKG